MAYYIEMAYCTNSIFAKFVKNSEQKIFKNSEQYFHPSSRFFRKELFFRHAGCYVYIGTLTFFILCIEPQLFKN